ITVGGNFTNYSVDYYSYELTSQAFGSVYRQRPIQRALWVEDQVTGGAMQLKLGLRYDYFNSRAARPEYATPEGGKVFFPRISSADGFDPDNPSAARVFDGSQARLSPRIQLGYRASPRTSLRLGYAQEVAAPDFAMLYSGLNTDIQATNTSNVFGTALQFNRSAIWEAGLTYLVGNGSVLDIAGYQRNLQVMARSGPVTVYDPVRNSMQDIREYHSVDDVGRIRGIDVRISQRVSSLLTGMLSYSYQDGKATLPARTFPPAPAMQLPFTNSHPQTFSATLAYYPRSARSGPSSSGLLRGLGAYATYRIESGSVYCGGLLGICNNVDGLAGNDDARRLPTTHRLDLRITKNVTLGGRALTLYLDARNLLNTRNIVRLLATSGKVEDPLQESVTFRQDSASFAQEANRNNVYNTATGAIDLTFGGAGRSGCADFVSVGGESATPDCLYLLQAEERWGNGDHVFSLDEQQRASEAFYLTTRGIQEFTGDPRRIRLGVQIGF
ncbi:MAG TPA: TonB-dependent receptor, partial [Gemmatimonadales bacterium]|nr:TonB-dependent receptor [Gemmatimonadales bacterium]